MTDERLGENPVILTLGLGEVATSHGFYKGLPCIWLVQAKCPGVVGQEASREINEHGGLDSPVCIRFNDMDAVIAHLDRVKYMIAHLEKTLSGGVVL